MSAVNEITSLLLNTLITLALFAFLLRMIFQLVRADYYNPICQFVAKVTSPVVVPLRRAVPSMGRLDSASLLLAVLVQALGIAILFKLYTGGFPNPAQLLLWSIIGVCAALLKIYFIAIIASIIMSWVAQGSYHPGAQLLQQMTEPVLAPFRKLIPAVGGLDLSPILVFLCINVLEVLLRHAAGLVGLHPALVMGL